MFWTKECLCILITGSIANIEEADGVLQKAIKDVAAGRYLALLVTAD